MSSKPNKKKDKQKHSFYRSMVNSNTQKKNCNGKKFDIKINSTIEVFKNKS